MTVDEVPDAKIEKSTDVLVKIITANICGSDLHIYEGRTDVEQGKMLSHENMGQVIEIGSGVVLKVGDYVMLSDILPTGCQGTELAQVGIGESVVIDGTGPA